MKYIYPGAIHIHSTYSDGTSNIKEIAKQAKKAGLAWIIITDHNTLKGLENNEEGFYDGVAVIIGNEISPKAGNHYLGLNVNHVTDVNLTSQEFIDDVKNQGGFGFIAHPDESLNRKNHYRPLIWDNWEAKGFDGIEIWNWLSDFVDNFTEDQNAVWKYLFRHHIVKGPTKKVLNWWDKTNLEQEKIIPAIGGVDAHALKLKKGPITIKIGDYFDSFKAVNNLIYLKEKLSKDFLTAKKQILNATKAGNNIIMNRFWSKNFPVFYAESKTGKAYAGETLTYDKYSKIIIKLPKKANLRIILDGSLIWEYQTKTLEYDLLDVGKYRIEAYLNDKPFIFSNPILVK